MKRLFDLFVASTLLVITLPLQIVIALAIWWTMGRPVCFRQMRPGRHEKLFAMYKFRTMRQTKESGVSTTDAERLTKLGKFLRSSSLDELPELWNILRGEMSLVGPRPLLVEYLPRYNAAQRRRHEVRPGLTGWAQINGRNAISWEEKFQLDLWYVEHQSFWLDMKILWLTFWKVIQREGVSAQGHATMPEFLGSSTPDVPGPSDRHAQPPNTPTITSPH